MGPTLSPSGRGVKARPALRHAHLENIWHKMRMSNIGPVGAALVVVRACMTCNPRLMNTSTVEISTADGVADAYLPAPTTARPPRRPAAHRRVRAAAEIEEMVDRVAEAATSCWRPTSSTARDGAGRAGTRPDDPDAAASLPTLRPLMKELTPERNVAPTAPPTSTASPSALRRPVAITGYCMGGRHRLADRRRLRRSGRRPRPLPRRRPRHRRRGQRHT